MSKVGLVSGDNGTGKTTFALSSEGKKDYYEFDAGSYDRAVAGLDINEDDITVHQYYAPLTNLMGAGKISVSERGGIAPATVHRLSGWKELFWTFVNDYLTALDGPGYPIFDTETKLWLMIRQSFLQEVQDAAGPDRERLDKLQYTEPNARHSQLIEAARIKGKDLIMLSHEKELYTKSEATGLMVHDGFKEVPNMVDYSLRFVLKNKKPLATFTKAGAGGLSLLGMEVESPTIPMIHTILDGASMLRRKGMVVPGTYDKFMETVEALAE